MKIQIDTAAKTVKIEGTEKIKDVLKVLKKMLPDEWENYSLEAVTIIWNWYNPVTIPYTYTVPASQSPTITCDPFTTCNYLIQ